MRYFLLLLLLFCSPVGADTWSHSGTSWKHSNGLTITFPADFQVQDQGNGVLSVQGKQGFVSYTVQGMQGEKLFKDWVKAQQRTFQDEGMTVKQEFQHEYPQKKVSGRFMESERTSQQGIAFVVVAASFQQGKDYLCMQFYYPKEREKDWGPLLNGVFESIHR